jgi:hypothetical protein
MADKGIPFDVPTRANLLQGQRLIDEQLREKSARDAKLSPLDKAYAALEAARTFGSGILATVGSLPTRAIKGEDAAQEYINQRMYIPTTEKGMDYVGNVANFLEQLETKYKMPPVLPEAVALQNVMGPAAKQATKQAAKAAKPVVGKALEEYMFKQGLALPAAEPSFNIPAGLKPSEKDKFVRVYNAMESGDTIPRSTKNVQEVVGDEKDIARSLLTDPTYKQLGQIPTEDIDAALSARKRYRSEPAKTPGKNASEQDWAKWGEAHGVNMTRTPDVSLGITDLTSKREVKIPGGLEGTFTIPDLFHMKAQNINPASLPKDVHDQLMKKFIRTHNIENPDEVDIFNRLNFALLSPNAPLTPNEFLAQRARLVNKEELEALASRVGEQNLAQTAGEQLGVGAAGRGGMGVAGTANLGNQATLAKLILEKPEMFKIQPGETMRDVTMRVMNQVPGLGPKTASLGTPWLDLNKANTSAVDLHMIRNSYKRMLDDPEVGEAFRERMGSLLKTEPTTEAILNVDPKKVEDAAIGIIGGTDLSRMYRLKTGELNKIPASSTPDKLAYEPKSFREFNPFYNKVVDYVDESRGANPVIELFPEQWRKWDIYRQRIEPHEFAHPDFRKLPRQSWSEMADSLSAHKEAGYTQANDPVMKDSDWRKLYYGRVSPEALLPLGAASAGALALEKLNQDKPKEKSTYISDNPDTMMMEVEDQKFVGGGIAKAAKTAAKSAVATRELEKQAVLRAEAAAKSAAKQALMPQYNEAVKGQTQKQNPLSFEQWKAINYPEGTQGLQNAPQKQTFKYPQESLPAEERDANLANMFKDSQVKQRVYHGTNKDIKSFDPSKAGENYGVDKEGMFFTSNPEMASMYAQQDPYSFGGTRTGANVMPVYLNLKNPLVINDQSAKKLGLNLDFDEGTLFDNNRKKILDLAKQGGHDGVQIGEDYIAFKPNQIKSAIGNRGTFDINEADINKAAGGAVFNTDPDMSDGGQIIQGAPFKHGGDVNLDAMYMAVNDAKFRRK